MNPYSLGIYVVSKHMLCTLCQEFLVLVILVDLISRLFITSKYLYRDNDEVDPHAGLNSFYKRK